MYMYTDVPALTHYTYETRKVATHSAHTVRMKLKYAMQ